MKNNKKTMLSVLGLLAFMTNGDNYAVLGKDEGVVSKLNFITAYKEPLTNFNLMLIVITIFIVDFTVFGSFTYSGKLLQQLTGFTVLQVGLILSFFGLGTVTGSRIAPKVKMLLKHGFLISAEILGFSGLFILLSSSRIPILCTGFFLFGIAFIFLQSTLVSTAQAKLPERRGTAMSLASFNMFVGGAVGTAINGRIILNQNINSIFFYSSFILLSVGILEAVFTTQFKIKQTEGN